ncbi:L-serine ammonia-lyase, partial [Mycobacterium sp. ITM-2017-0098]
MAVSVFDLFSIGIGPSSSHTVGPMRAARRFVDGLAADGVLTDLARVRVELYGSLGATGAGHGTPGAVVLGLEGAHPETVDPEAARARVDEVGADKRLRINGARIIDFDIAADIVLSRRPMDFHSNGMVFGAFDGAGSVLARRVYYSVGGG